MGRRTYLVACLVVLLLGGGSRLHRLAERSLWLDEAKVAVFARQPVLETVSRIRLAGSSPVVHPLLLNLVQRVDDSALAVRLPSALFSLAAVAVLFCLPRVGLPRPAALIAGAVLAVSPSQVRYAQEVREYSLSVLVAALLILAFASSLRGENGKHRTAPFLLGLFVAPLVQYGLVLFAVALVLTWTAARARDSGRALALRSSAAAAGVLAAGCAVTFVLTLAWQWRVTTALYLRSSFYRGPVSDLHAVLGFLGPRFAELMPYLTQGDGAVVLALPALGMFLLARPAGARNSRLLVGLAVLSTAIVGAAAVADLYPFGPSRHDLFLAPTVATALGLGWNALSDRVRGKGRTAVTVAFLGVLLAAGVLGIVRANPYREQEDIKSVIAALPERPVRGAVYVYYGAQPALRFYKIAGPEFVYGRSHRGHPEEYAAEFRQLVGAERGEVWLIFSHVYANENQRMLDDLGSQWRFQPVVTARGASLYRGRAVDGAEPLR